MILNPEVTSSREHLLTDGNVLVVATEQELLAGQGRDTAGQSTPASETKVIQDPSVSPEGEEV